MQKSKVLIGVGFIMLWACSFCYAQSITPEIQAKIDVKLKSFLAWGTDPVIVKAVKEYTANPPDGAKEMTNEKWKALSVLDPFARSFATNALAQYLKSKKDDTISEMFVSNANGWKVAFLAKTTSWSHIGKEKHDMPMTGKTWQGKPEVDESSGQYQVQVSLPILDENKPIGSIVIGLNLTKL